MNAAKVKKSDRLKSVLELLKQKKAFSTRDIIRATGVCAVSAIISELRQNGYRITCMRQYNQKQGKTIYYYKLN